MRLLLVEDDEKLASFVVNGFRQAGFAVDRAADGETGLDLALSESYDVCVIDIMLPGLDGLSLIEEMRRKKKNTPVIILSAKRSVEDRVKGLQIGSDDYLVKPFSFSELLARVYALMRRTRAGQEITKITVGDLSLDLVTREVFYGNRKIDLQPREFSLLEYLMRNNNRVLSKTMIMEHVWDYSFDPQTNVVDVLVCRLRKKIEEAEPKKQIIHTIRGVGYVLKPS
ncbi:MAG: response regulator transcription factor [Syntrophorhabdaceae bacterium]|nr:response regulator transcription factor [Syntrophorhabdaceae bacterium]